MSENHRNGSRKAQVHQAFEAQGADGAMGKGRELDLKDLTIRCWVNAWKRSMAKAKRGRKNPAPSKETVEAQ
jgi:hypothetical protein